MSIPKLRNVELSADWWTNMTPEQRKAYINDHPNSKYAHSGPGTKSAPPAKTGKPTPGPGATKAPKIQKTGPSDRVHKAMKKFGFGAGQSASRGGNVNTVFHMTEDPSYTITVDHDTDTGEVRVKYKFGNDAGNMNATGEKLDGVLERLAKYIQKPQW